MSIANFYTTQHLACLTTTPLNCNSPTRPWQAVTGSGCPRDELLNNLDRRRRAKHSMTEFQLPDGTHNAEDARDWLCAACEIQSRAELDHNPTAEAMFRRIRQRFLKWKQQGRQQ